MRLFLLPVSTRRTLLYCERIRETAAPGTKPPLSERITTKASETWLAWEKKNSGWQFQVTKWGNSLLRRIPFEEFSLRSIPALTAKRIEDLENKKLEIDCHYPPSFVKREQIPDMLGKMAKERQALHRQRLIYCLIGMPISAPFMIVPVIPNLPFYYLVYRAYCHYTALYGGKMLEHVVSKKLIGMAPSQRLDEMYAAGLMHPTKDAAKAASPPSKEEIAKVQQEVEAQGQKEVVLLQKHNSELFAQELVPELQVEIERAVDQVESAIKKAEGNVAETKKSP